MMCPIDDVALVMSERSGIEIDYCPKCRGVWLDRGELDKIIEKSQAAEISSQPYQEPATLRRNDNDAHGSDDDRQYGKRRKKEGFLGELFDF
jgi:Zn-finger nucleic acid-binding protein